jgi:hypothetical protein
LVLSLEMSRLSRCNKDWAHLIEVCALFHALLADQDGIYDATDLNDRLLLGLKGTMSEVELAMMRNRLERGRQNKAARGELFEAVPIGYVKLPDGGVALDPDEQVRAVVRLIFDRYDELGSVYALVRYLLAHQIRLDIRSRERLHRGRLEWRQPSTRTLHFMLRHPMYAGAYVHGRSRRQPQPTPDHAKAVMQRKQLPRQEWGVLLRDRLPAYITWERYEANLERLRRSRSGADSPGVPRRGRALLAGIVICGCCGCRHQIQYKDTRKSYYHCTRKANDPTQPPCPGVPSSPRGRRQTRGRVGRARSAGAGPADRLGSSGVDGQVVGRTPPFL